MSSLRRTSEKNFFGISGRSMARLHSCLFASTFTKGVDHVSGGGTPGSTVLCELARHFHALLSLSCVADDSRPGDRFQVGLDRGCPSLQLDSSSA